MHIEARKMYERYMPVCVPLMRFRGFTNVLATATELCMESRPYVAVPLSGPVATAADRRADRRAADRRACEYCGGFTVFADLRH